MSTDPAANRAKTIFLAAIEKPKAERAAFARDACAGDTDLIDKVMLLLQAHELAEGGFLTAPTAGPPSTSDRRLLEGLGTRIGPYKLLELIGEGGFGSVFMAEQERPVRRRVALKIIKPGMDSKMVSARFEAERQALALMDHPHIARVFDGGVTDAAQGARPYFVMEYVRGDPITAFADAHTLSVQDRLRLFTQVCEAVQHAHTKGVIHRDLKPSNVLTSMVDGKPFAKVIDFGIAKATGAALTDKTLFTEHRQLIGTPEYMSPEQAEGSPDIDTRTDVYGLGVLLYELLTGLTPFDGARLRSAAFAELQRIIKEEEPPAPSIRLTRDLQTLAKTAAARREQPARLGTLIKGELDWIVLKALDKDRARRYETPNQFADDVRRHLAGEAVVAAPVSRWYRVRKFVKRNKGAVGAVSAVAAALVIGGGVAAWQWRAASRAEADKAAQIDELDLALHEISRAAEDAAQRGGPGIVEQTDPKSVFPGISLESAPDSQVKRFTISSPSSRVDHLKANALWYINYSVEAKSKLMQQTAEAERSVYTTNLASANIAMQAGNWPEARERLQACPQSQRGWEWTWMWRRAQSVVTTIGSGGVFSPDGTRVLTLDEPPIILDLDGREVGRCEVGKESVRSSWVSDDHRFVCVLMQSGRLHVFNADGTPARPPLDVDPNSRLASISPDGSTVAVVGRDGNLRLWNKDNAPVGEPIRSEVADELINSIVWSPDGRRMAIRSGKTKARVWSSEGRALSQVRDISWRDIGWRFSPDSERLVINVGQSAVMWSADKPDEWRELTDPASGAERAVFSPDGTRLAVVCWPDSYHWSEVRLFDGHGAPTGRSIRHTDHITAIAFSPDSQLIVTASEDRTARLWDRDGRPIGRVMRHQDVVAHASFSPDGRTVYTTCLDGTLRAWDLQGRPVGGAMGGQASPELSAFELSPSAPRAVVLAKDEAGNRFSVLLNTRVPSAQAFAYDWSEGSSRLALETGLDDAPEFAPAQDPKGRATLSEDGRVKLKDAGTEPARPGTIGTLQGRVSVIAWTPDGTRLITGGEDAVLRVWDTRDWRELVSDKLDSPITQILLSADGTRMVVSTTDGYDMSWDLREPEARRATEARVLAQQDTAEAAAERVWASAADEKDLEPQIDGDAALSKYQKAYARVVLKALKRERDAVSRIAFAEISERQTDPAVVRAAAGAADLPPRVKAVVIACADKWTYTPRPPSAEVKLAEAEKKVELTKAQLEEKVRELSRKTDEAEWNAYTANLNLAQSAMQSGNWPEARERLEACPESTRGWEWTLLHRQGEQVEVELPGGFASPAAFSRDGSRFVTASRDGDIRVWETATGRLLGGVTDNQARVKSAILSPDGTKVLVHHWDGGSARVWDWRRGTLLHQIEGDWERTDLDVGIRENPGNDLAFSPDGSRVIGTRYGVGARVVLWDANNGQPVVQMAGGGVSAYSAVSADGARMLVVSPERLVQLRSAQTGQVVTELPRQPGGAVLAAFSPDGSTILTTYEDGRVILWDAGSLKELRRLGAADGWVDSVEFGADGQRVMTVQGSNAVVWDIKSGERLCRVPTDGWVNHPPHLSADGRHLITFDKPDELDRGRVRVWDASTGELVHCVDSDGRHDLHGAVLSRDGQTVAIGLSAASINQPDRTIFIRVDRGDSRDRLLGEGYMEWLERAVIEAETAGPRSTVEGQGHRPSIATPDGTRTIIGHQDGSVRFIDTATQREAMVYRTGAAVTDLRLSADGSLLAITMANSTMRLLDGRPSDVQAEAMRRQRAEQVPAAEYVQKLWDGDTPTRDLHTFIRDDASITPLRRWVASIIDAQRISDWDAAVGRAMDALTKGQTDPVAVRAAARAADLPPRVKAEVIARADEWTYTPPSASAEVKLAEAEKKVELTRAELAEKVKALEAANAKLEAQSDGAINALKTLMVELSAAKVRGSMQVEGTPTEDGSTLYVVHRRDKGDSRDVVVIDPADWPELAGSKAVQADLEKVWDRPQRRVDAGKAMSVLSGLVSRSVSALREETRKARLAEADLIMQLRLRQPEDPSFTLPTTDELRHAWEARVDGLGAADARTTTAQLEYGKSLAHDGVGAGLSLIDQAIASKEAALSLPNEELVSAWADAFQVFSAWPDPARAEPLAAKLADAIVPAYLGGRLVHIPGRPESNGHMVFALTENYSREWAEDVAARYRSLKGTGLSSWIAVCASDAAWYRALDHESGLPVTLQQAERAQKLAPADTQIMRAIALVRYRMGELPIALEQVTLALSQRAELQSKAVRDRTVVAREGQGDNPLDHTLLAMIRFKLGGEANIALAREALAKARAIMADPSNADTWAKDANARALLQEAAGLIEGVPAAPK